MERTLLVTNDFPPRPGGIQSYLENLLRFLPPEDVIVYAPKWKGCEAYDAAAPYRIVRHRTTLMIPTPFVARKAARLVRDNNVHTVWFGAAAPLAVLGPHMRRAGAKRVVASTHGHEVGWSMLPGSRQILRYIGDNTDVVTYVSRYTRGRFASAFGRNAALEYVSCGVDVDRFAPDAGSRRELRERYGLGDAPVVLCLSRLVPRKGQDVLIEAWPRVLESVPDARLVIVGGGPYGDRLRDLAVSVGVTDSVMFTGSVPAAELPKHHAMADVFAMPTRTRGRGLDVEGLGIVFLEASASGVPVVAGDSGGAPETVREGETGTVVDGRDRHRVADAITDILTDPQLAESMGRAGRAWAVDNWQWRQQAARLMRLL
ncbi:glycosyltransferase family 4 protein [Gordonia malaquae]|jgi:phosphatidylinositol alpha-1,6-mannosyltransferase|uniref:phosphatidyl-myo-inositol dimannoside synthase n=1 Tax=Gordonia malaquae NBRC 108250 TaxID=1223542 RepID=M3UH57_GORML|nr:glycosyltransferase family 4 protein [Gordonia malaquae]GAC78660.1 GDP-mannose-dependent alpha-(1-6)-phosphatidylinositol monomannoside mannosyltransferase [Gordonia malaquae NBRC 108250]SED58602.1 phosphatidylinositol alpha-1,6-mannosyltransferase [Gordonia malaquae]